MLTLALDAAGAACSAAIVHDGRVIGHRFAAMARGQAEVLAPMVAEAMGQAGIDFTQLDLVAASVGPGTFTGIRIGLAMARALGLAAAKPVAGIASTDTVAAAIPEDLRAGRMVLVVLDSRRPELWVQPFAADLTPIADIQAMTADELTSWAADLGPLVLAGDGAVLVAAALPDAILASVRTDATQVALLAEHRWPRQATLPAEPLYLRPPDVTLATPAGGRGAVPADGRGAVPAGGHGAGMAVPS